MKNKLIYISFFVAIALIGCKSKDTGPVIKFTGITETDKFGAVVGVADSTDWRTDDVWIEKEKALFKTTYTENAPQPDRLSIMFYANPCRGQSVLYMKKDSTTRIDIRLVDKEFNVVFSQDSIFENKQLMNLNSLNVNDTFRLYYKLIDKDNNEFKGHGDINLWVK